MVIPNLMECGIGAMDVEEIGVASAAAPMVTMTMNQPQRIDCRMVKQWMVSSLDG